jgi:SAM-dependent methyltransferase
VKTYIHKLKKLIQPLSKYPLHPQWIIKSSDKYLIEVIQKIPNDSTVLDIGCFNKWPAKHIHSSCLYIGLDYYVTAKEWYKSTPDIYGDAIQLPILNNSIDVILLLDVFEHIKDSDKLFAEIFSALKPGGQLIIQVPFMYPLHDQPRDYYRVTSHGFDALADSHGFNIDTCKPVGTAMETALLLANIAVSKMLLECFRKKSMLSLFVVFLPIVYLLNNSLAYISRYIDSSENEMPNRYQLIMRKPVNPQDRLRNP